MIESGWLIEVVQEEDDMQSYANSALGIQGGHWRWVGYDNALRFARQEDAEAVASVEVSDQNTFAAEHRWG